MKMEDLLTHVIAISNNFPEIEKAAQEAVDFLRIQQGLIRDPAYELREKCLLVLQLCLETKRSKFTAIAIAGFQKILRDDRFHSNIEPDDDSKWLPLQLLQATKSFLTQPDDTQVDILKILLNIACSKKWTMSGRTLISILSLCSEAFESGNAAIRAAAQAAASQYLRSFCLALEEELEDDLDVSAFNVILPIMQFICSKIDEAECSSHCEHGVVFLLECLLTLCSSLPQEVFLNQHLNTFFWQKLCPVLISVLGTPKVDKNIVTRNSEVEKERGRGSGGLKYAPSFNNFHARTVYSINNELVRLFGSVVSLRPVLESVFHRVLLYPAPEHRLDALRAAMELVRNVNRLLCMNGPLIQENNSLPVSDMSLLRLIMDSVEESSKSVFSVMQASVMCCFGLLKAIEELSAGHCIPPKTAEILCQMFPKLMDCDYKGPRTYQSTARLPQRYRDSIEKEEELIKQKNDIECVLNKQDYDSDSSGDTEGPEERSTEEYDAEIDKEEFKKIPTTLGVVPYASTVGLGDIDRQRAKHFVKALHELLPLLMPMRSSIQVDQALQSFSSQYCEGIVNEQSGTEWNMVNAEGIYLAVYSALLLDMHLFQSNYYFSPNKQIAITEESFVTKVKGYGIFAYLSHIWLRELYQIIVTSSLLQLHGYLPTNHNSQPHALINLLTDVEGLISCQQGSQMLWECRRLKKPTITNDDNLEREAGLRLSRRILTCCLDTLLKVLAVPLSQKQFKLKSKKLGDLKILGNEDRYKQMKQLITMSIQGLQIVAKLCNNLGLQDRCGSILELLASASCTDSDKKKTRLMRLQPANNEIVRLTPSHSLSLELLLGSGLELGSHCSDCWPHIFRCCIYVKKLERKYFSKSENRALGSTTKVTRKGENLNGAKNSNLTFDPEFEEDSCVDVYSFLCASELPQTVSELISNLNQSSTDILKPAETGKIICVLSQLVDKLFEDAALKLNLKSLESFSLALCSCSQKQLFPAASNTDNSKRYWWQIFSNITETSADTLLLDSVGEIMLKTVRSGRPLFHVMRIWAIIGPHLTEAACHKDLTVSRKAIKQIHDTINAALAEHSELPHFHVTETLFKPFENLLCLQLCEPDIQDQIVSCICEFVEANFREIHSGWRPLFGSLRALSTNVNILLDVFRVFLETDNVLVFSYAAVDYIMCLLKHLRAQCSCNSNTDVGFETLKYLKRCQDVLSSMYKMPHCVAFHSAHHIQVSDGLLVDPVIIDFESFTFDHLPEGLEIEPEISYSPTYFSPLECTPSLDTIDRPSGVLHVWFLLLEGMHSAAISANSTFQPYILNLLYSDLLQLMDNPGPIFGLIAFNRIVLPMTQSWLRQLAKIDGDFSGLKQSIGLLSDLVLQYFDRLYNDKTCENLLNLLLHQVFLLLSECSIHPIPAVAKIGPACIRHIILSVGSIFTCDQWKCVTASLYRTCDITLMFLRQLMVPFSRDSQYYYGDSGQVKVTARRAFSAQDINSTVQLAHRVFLLDEQHENIRVTQEDQKIYTFLVHNSEEDIIRISMKSLVIALQAHQSILEILAEILLHGTKHHVQSLANLLSKNGLAVTSHGSKINDSLGMPSLMGYLKQSEFSRLLSCLDYSYNCALAFDSRPGLKFLIQKVAGLEQAANLYRQAGAAWAIKLVALFEYCLAAIKRNHLSTNDVKKLLENSQTNVDPDLYSVFNKFRKSYNELCKTYVDVVLNNHNMTSPTQEKLERPLFFLIASQDDRALEDDMKDRNHNQNRFTNKKKEEPQTPFFLSDFSKQLNCDDSDGMSELNRDECGENLIDRKNEETQIDIPYNGPGKLHPSTEVINVGKIENKNFDETNLMIDDSMIKILKEYKRKKKNYSEPQKITVKNIQEQLVPPEIELQRRHSFLKDSEALHRVWTEMLNSVFELLQQLDDDEFQKLLPVYKDGVRLLMAHVSDSSLKQAVSEFFQRIAVVYGFGML